MVLTEELNMAHEKSTGRWAEREIIHRTAGRQHGPITRLMSPGDLGDSVKPFIFLDLFEVGSFHGPGFPPHPHSGIATLTTFLDGRMSYADSTGKSGELTTGAVEWMRAGAGVWHAGQPAVGRAMRGYQLWLALPPELELAPPESIYLDAERVRAAGPARVLLGTYEGMASPLSAPAPMTYLHVRLADRQRWSYRPEPDHTIAWVALNSGVLHVSGASLNREMAIFAEGNTPIDMVAEGDVELVMGSAVKHPYPLVSGYYSIHTSAGSLAQGERNIAALERTPQVSALRRGTQAA